MAAPINMATPTINPLFVPEFKEHAKISLTGPVAPKALNVLTYTICFKSKAR